MNLLTLLEGTGFMLHIAEAEGEGLEQTWCFIPDPNPKKSRV